MWHRLVKMPQTWVLRTPMNSTVMDSDRVLEAGKLPSALLASLLSTYVTTANPSVLVPPAPGHDAAVIRPDEEIIVKSDPITFATSAPAMYLLAVNANDIACLGGIPRWLTVTALFPERTTAGEVESLFAELSTACAKEDIAIIGGHSEVTPGIDRVLLSATLIGVASQYGILSPGGARAGDDLYLTRSAGIEGTSILATELPASALADVPAPAIESGRDMIRDPGISIVADARLAHATDGVHAMHDPTEGGVATAIHELADASSLGVEVFLDRIHVSSATRAICAALDISPYGLLSSGALLFAADPSARESLESAFSNADVGLARIGRMRPDPEERTATRMGTKMALPRYDADEITRAFARMKHD